MAAWSGEPPRKPPRHKVHFLKLLQQSCGDAYACSIVSTPLTSCVLYIQFGLQLRSIRLVLVHAR